MPKTNYTVEIAETSRDTMTARERIRIKDTSIAKMLDELLTEDGTPFIFKPVAWTILHVHNEASEDKDYPVYMIEAEGGNIYRTGSSNFFETFVNIWEEMNGEEFEIQCYKMPSKKRSGQFFTTCGIV